MNYTFFESLDTTPANSSIWSKKVPSDYTAHEQFSGFLLKHSKSTDETLARRFFVLDGENFLYKKDSATEQFSSYMRIQFAKVLIPGEDDLDSTPESILKAQFPIKLISRNKFSLVYAESEEARDRWLEAFTRVSIRTDFHTRFTVSKIIGAGAFANVYEAAEKKSAKLYGVKGFNKTYLEQESKGKLSLWNEISLLRSIDHPNLLKLHEVHETKNSVYLVFDLYAGGELAKIVDGNKRPLKEQEIVSIAEALLLGINYLASKDMVHRDIKPNNIILKRNLDIRTEDVVLVDFGLSAKAFQSDLLYKRCGTPGYIAPEIIGAKNVDNGFTLDPKSDVYSVGLILYYCIVGRNPFEKPDLSVDEILRKNLESNVDYPQEKFSKLDPELLKLVKSLLVADPKKRISAKTALKSPLFDSDAADEDEDMRADLDEFTETELSQKVHFIDSIRSLEKKCPMSKKNTSNSQASIGVNSKGGIELNDSKKKIVNMSSLYKQSLISRASKEGGSFMDDHDPDAFSPMDSSNVSSDGGSDGQSSGLNSPSNNPVPLNKDRVKDRVKRSAFALAISSQIPKANEE